jgi:DNA-binding transcriptional LysR family regulator
VVSKAITDLEHTLGVALVDRTPRGIEPNVYGRAFLASCRAVFDELRQGVQNIEFLSDPATGELRLGSTEPMAAGLASAILDRLSRQYLHVVFHVVEADVAMLLRELVERNIELVIGRFPPRLRHEEVEVETLLGERQHVVSGTQNPLAARPKLSLADLLHEPWILPPLEGMAGSQIQEAFHASGLEVPRPCLITYSMSLRISLLAMGRYLTIFPASMLEHSGIRPHFAVLPVELPASPRPAGIMTLKGRTLSALAQQFIACAREVAKSSTRDVLGGEKPTRVGATS